MAGIPLLCIEVINFVPLKMRAAFEHYEYQTGKQWLLPAAFGMCTGWLLIATVVNI
jgi:hypothetical protein